MNYPLLPEYVPSKTYETFWNKGEKLILTCPETTKKKQVMWARGSTPLENIMARTFGQGRIKITASGQVIIQDMREEDFATYICYRPDGTLQGILRVRLHERIVLNHLDIVSGSVFLVVVVILFVFIVKVGLLESEPQMDDLDESAIT